MDDFEEKALEFSKRMAKKPEVQNFFKQYSHWRRNHINEFEKIKKSLKYIFRKNGLALPVDWNELFTNWVFDSPKGSKIREVMTSYPQEMKFLELETIPKEYFIEWAKEETERISKHLEGEKELKEHSQKTRIDLEPKYRFYLLQKLKIINPKGIFFDEILSLNDRAKLLSKVLGYNERDCKDLLNEKTSFDCKKTLGLDDYLMDLTEKSKK